MAEIESIFSNEVIKQMIQFAELSQQANKNLSDLKTTSASMEEQTKKYAAIQNDVNKISRDQAIAMLRNGYGLTDEDMITWLGEDEAAPAKFSDDVIKVFAEFGESASNYSFLKKKTVKFKSTEAMIDNEILSLEFADVILNDLERSIIDLITKDNLITPEILADVTKTDLKVINDTLGRLEADGILKARIVGDAIERVPIKPLSKLAPGQKADTTSFKVMYSYEWKTQVPVDQRDTPEHPSREFCRKLISLDKLYSRADIENISARLGYSVFDRGGGWWGDSPSCRHTWMSNIVIKK
jgi:hypothetical protein